MEVVQCSWYFRGPKRTLEVLYLLVFMNNAQIELYSYVSWPGKAKELIVFRSSATCLLQTVEAFLCICIMLKRQAV